MLYRTVTLHLALAVVFAGSAYAQEVKKEEPKKDEPKKEEPKRDQRSLDYEKAIKDLPKSAGAWTIYTRKKDLLLELPESQLGKLFFVQPTFNTGASTDVQQGLPVTLVTTGEYGAIDMFRFEKKGDERVWLTRPNTKFRWEKDHWLAPAIERSFPQAYLSDFRIEQYDPEKKLLLINVSSLFAGDLFKVNEGIGRAMGMQCMPDREKTGVDKVTGAPGTSVVRMDHYYTCARGAVNPMLAALGLGGGSNNLEDDRSLNIKITYSVFYRNESDYKPRIYDSRIGYFTQDFTDFNKYLKMDRTSRFIMRWNLKKRDPKAKMSEPVKPIVWTIDNTVPKEYRDAAKKGFLEWNKAFEALGYRNAVQVVDAPANDPNYDHADSQRNVYRWSATNGFDGAIALMRTDPLTGEILNSGINFDATFVFQPLMELDTQGTLGTARALARQAAEPNKYTQIVGRNLVDMIQEGKSAAQPFFEAEMKKSGFNTVRCNYASEKAARLNRAFAAMPAMSAAVKKKAIEEFITDVTAHEAGHTFGLRHNFVGSTNISTAELGNEAKVREIGMSSSVMDYVDLNPMAILKGHTAYFNPTIGKYDLWAIKYGYMDVPSETPQGELHALSQVAKLSGAPGLEFMTDENADSFDPRVVRFDGAKDPINFQAAFIEVDKRVRANAIKNFPAPGQSYEERNRLIVQTLGWQFRDLSSVTRFIGGMNGFRAFKGDAGERPNLVPVSAAEQRQAVNLIVSEGLSESNFNLPESVLNSMARDYAQESSGRWTAPIRGYIAGRQAMLLGQLFSADKLDRVAENEYKTKSNPYTISEHYNRIVGAVTSELQATKDVSPIRRDLQNSLVDLLLAQAASSCLQDDARNSANESLRYIARLCSGYGSKALVNGSTRTHVNAILATIQRFESRGRVEVSGGAGSSMFGREDLLELLTNRP